MNAGPQPGPGAGLPKVGDSALVAEIYNVSNPVGSSYGDVEYYAAALRDVAGPVLELACGTGRVLLPLMEAGLAMQGLDVSAAMLDLCQANARRRGLNPPLHRADMADFAVPHRFAAVIIPSGSTKELAGPCGLANLLRCCHACLLPGGQLIFDIAPPRRTAAPSGLRHWSSGATLWTRQLVHVNYDSAADRSTEFLRYEKFQGGRLMATELHALRVQHFSPEEVRRAMAANGFRLVCTHANYQEGRPLGPNDDDWTFRAVVDGPPSG